MRNPFSAVFFTGAMRLIYKGLRKRLRERHLRFPESEKANNSYARFGTAWEREVRSGRNSLLLALARCFWFYFLLAGLFKLCWGALTVFTASFFVYYLVDFVENGGPFGGYGWVLCGALLASVLLMSLCLQQMMAFSSKLGIRVRAALMTAVYNKGLRLATPAINVGDIVGLVANDCSRLYEACASIHYLWSGALESFALIAVMIYLLGLPALAGLGLALVMVPLQLLVGYLITRSRGRCIAATDTRVHIVHEILLAIKLVKLYAWEKSFASSVAAVREREVRQLRLGSHWKSLNLMVVFAIPPLIALSVFAAYVLSGNTLLGRAALTFTVLSLANSLRFPLVVLPKSFRILAESIAAVKRVRAFLLKEELRPLERSAAAVGVRMRDATFCVQGCEEAPIVRGVSMDVEPGAHVAVVGPVGGGKSGLIHAILGELDMREDGGELAVGGRIAYVPQEAWMQQATVRENIAFGMPYDEEKYRRVVRACALQQDFRELANGDMTEIGEGGINLSGGQRQRISLARACYSEADLYLLDSPLSAVDEYTSTHIFDYCIKGMLKDKAVLMVTHKLQFLGEFDKVGVMAGGRMAYWGEYSPSLLRERLPGWQPPQGAAAAAAKNKRRDGEAKPVSMADIVTSMEDLEEDEATVRSRKRAAYRAWVGQMGAAWAILALLLIAFVQAIRIASDYWLAFWTKDSLSLASWAYIASYGALVLSFTVLLYFRGIFFYTLTLRAASRIHDQMFGRVLRAPMSHFAVTPLGVLLNCASKDQDKVDETLPDAVHLTLVYGVVILTTAVLVCIVLPYYTPVLVSLLALFVLVEFLTFRTGAYLRSLTAATNGPIFAHISETFQGIAVVRAFRAEDRFARLNMRHVDRNHAALHNLDVVGLFLSLCLDTISCLLVLGTALLCVGLAPSLEGPEVGLAISNAIQQLVFFTLVAKEFAQADFHVDSVWRIVRNARDTPVESQEGALAEERWPPRGAIEFDRLEMRYSPDADPVFRDLSFAIKAGTKVGVVGRTGSGKSSLLMCLFRMVDLAQGTIRVDGVDIRTLALESLRRSLSIIPQESALFKGTIRSNVDPFGEHSDDELWDALDKSHLRDFVESMPLKLDSLISAARDNFSLGQKQLFCVARAVLNDSKVVVLDEATSAMDPATDALVQQTVRRVFADRTVVAIAHRLDTIIDYDMILFLERGRVLEFDTVENLLADEKSHFFKIAAEAGLARPSQAQGTLEKKKKKKKRSKKRAKKHERQKHKNEKERKPSKEPVHKHSIPQILINGEKVLEDSGETQRESGSEEASSCYARDENNNLIYVGRREPEEMIQSSVKDAVL